MTNALEETLQLEEILRILCGLMSDWTRNRLDWVSERGGAGGTGTGFGVDDKDGRVVFEV